MSTVSATPANSNAWSLIAQANKFIEQRDQQIKTTVEESKKFLADADKEYEKSSNLENEHEAQLLLQKRQVEELDIESGKIDVRIENLEQNPGWQLGRIASSAKKGFQKLQEVTCSCLKTVAVIAVSSGAPTIVAYGLGQNPLVLVICGVGGAAAGGITMAAYNGIKRCCNPKNDKKNYESLES